LAQSGHELVQRKCLLSGVKPTLQVSFIRT
jgi:hypothetical protein